MTEKFHCFKCFSIEDDLSHGRYIAASEPTLYHLNTNKIDCYSFFGQYYDQSVWLSDIKYIFFLAEKGIKQLEQASRKTDVCQITNYGQIRNYICEVWFATRYLIREYKNKNEYNEILNDIVNNIRNITRNLTRIKDLPEYVIFNTKNQPSYNYLHMYLDLKWLMITLEYEYETDVLKQLENFERNIKILFTDLIYISHKKFERGCEDLENGSFLCSCFKEVWLLLQLFIEELNKQQFCKDFWSYFNDSLREFISIENSSEGKEPLFYLWLLFNIGEIQGYDRSGVFLGPSNSRVISNYQLVELCLKSILQSTINEKQMRTTLKIISKFQTIWWTRDTTFDLLQLLWEHFYKRINSSFMITTDTNPFINTSSKFFNFDAILNDIQKCNFHSYNSYDIFLCLLMMYLKKNPSFWSKLKGRIYSKISPAKLGTFNDIGLQNFILLFLILAHCVNFSELTEKLLALLNQLPQQRKEENAVVWSAHISIIIMYIKQELSIRTMSTSFLDIVTQASSDRRRAQLMQIFVNGLTLIEDITTFQCCEHILFSGNWLGRYLQWCPHSEICNLLELLGTLINKLKTIGVTQEWHSTIESRIVPQIIELSNNPDAPVQVAEIAASIVAIDGKRYSNLVEHLTADNINIEIVEKFLRYLLERSDVYQITSHQSVLIQAWIKLSLLSINQHSLFDISQLITQLPQWLETIGVFNVRENEDPLHVLIKTAGMRVRDANTMTEIAKLKRWFDTCFGRMDKWVLNVLNMADKVENNKLLLKVYTSGALLFIHCAPALYTKNKTTSLFHRLVSTMLLPTSILMNKRPPDNMLAAMKITWHMFVRGIVRFDYRNDTYIERIFKDFVIRYIPYLNDYNSPIIRCLDSELKDDDATFILDKIISLIAYKSRTVNEFAPQALNLILEMIKAKSDGDINKIKIFTKIVMPSLLEQLMFVDNRTRHITIQIIENIKDSSHYNELRDIVKSSVLSVIDKHMAFYSTSVFQMLEALAKMLKSEIRDIEDNLKEAVQKVERMRGVGYDNTLRKGLQDVQQIIKS